MAEYVDGDPDKGILQEGEIMRSRGWGWILCLREKVLLLQVLIGRRVFTEKQLYLTPEETAGFEESGQEFLDDLHRQITSRPGEYEERFIKQ